MPNYVVWATNDVDEWSHCLLETEQGSAAKEKAHTVVESRQFRFVALDCDGRTIWSNDPNTPTETD